MLKSEIENKVLKLKNTYKTRKTQNVEWRREQLKALERMLTEEAPAIQAAAYKDFHRSAFDSYVVDVRALEIECQEAIRQLNTWTKDIPASVTFVQFPSSSFLRPEPLGTVLILGTWNFPMSTTVGLAISAIAAGNCVLLKPSEISSASAQMMADSTLKHKEKEHSKMNSSSS